jgi:hypothetical protein
MFKWYAAPWVHNLTGEWSCVFKEISSVAIVVPSIYRKLDLLGLK